MIYIIMLIISLLFAELYYFKNKTNHKKYNLIYIILSMLPFLIISSFRYDVGTDYFFRYVNDFQLFINGKNVPNLEIGFNILYWLLSFITKDYILLFIVTSSTIIIPLFYTIYKYSKRPSVSIFLFFICGYFFSSMNMVRQFVSIIILFSTIHFLLEKKYIKWSFFLIMSILIHKSSIIFFPVILLCKKLYFSPKTLFALIAIFLIFSNPLHNLINNIIKFSPFYYYANTNFLQMDLQVTPFIINILIYLYLYYVYKIQLKESNNKEDVFFLNIQGLSVIFCALSEIMSVFSRVAYFFSIFSIISIVNFTCKKITKKIIILIIILCIFITLSLIKTHFIANNDEVFPYKTIWQR